MHRMLRIQITKWLSYEPQPGFVEAEFTDARGRTWTFHEKTPYLKIDPKTLVQGEIIDFPVTEISWTSD